MRIGKFLLSLLGVSALLGGCLLQPVSDVQTYTLLDLVNPVDLDRPQQVVEIPVHQIRRRYKAFDPTNFSVHRLPRDFLPGGDPLLASNPPPEVAAQVVDNDGDGNVDALLLLMDFLPKESLTVAVASPRFSLLNALPPTEVSASLWQRESIRDDGAQLIAEGAFAERQSLTIPVPGRGAAQLFQYGGPFFENHEFGWRLPMDRVPVVDLIGKRSSGLQLSESLSVTDYEDLQSTAWGGSLLGDAGPFGAGGLGALVGNGIVPITSVGSINYRQISDGPVLAQTQLQLNSCLLGDARFDLTWTITVVAGMPALRHEIGVSRTGHNLAFALRDKFGEVNKLPSHRTGWMQTLTYGSQNVTGDAAGALGLGIMLRGWQSAGFVQATPDTIGVLLDSSKRKFTLWVVAGWSEAANAVASVEGMSARMNSIAYRENHPIEVHNIDYPGL